MMSGSQYITVCARLLLLLPMLCLLLASGPYNGLVAHGCEHEHDRTEAADQPESHDDAQCGCACHATTHLVLTELQDAHYLFATRTTFRHLQPVCDPPLSSIDRPPRLYS